MRARPPRLRFAPSLYLNHSNLAARHPTPSPLLPQPHTTPNVKAWHQEQTRSIKTIAKRVPKPNRHDRSNPDLPLLTASPMASQQRKEIANTLPLRTGAVATKRGMTALFDPSTGQRTPCTVLQLDRNQVIAHKTMRKHGYWAVCVGEGRRNPENVGRAMLGVFAGAQHKDENGGVVGVGPKKEVREFRVRDEKGLLDIGKELRPSWFIVGQYVDTQSKTRGMGFAGGMKRHGWRGQDRSHGVSLAHRSMGSAGGGQGSGSRVHPGKKMPGRMGGQLHTVQNLRVLLTDDANGLVVVNGAVPGPKKVLVKISDAKKKPWPEVPESAQEAVEKMASEPGQQEAVAERNQARA